MMKHGTLLDANKAIDLIQGRNYKKKRLNLRMRRMGLTNAMRTQGDAYFETI